MGFSLINPPFWGSPIYGNPHEKTMGQRCRSGFCDAFSISIGEMRLTQKGGVSPNQNHIWLVVWLPFFIFSYVGNNHPNWLIFFRGVAQPPTRYVWSIGTIFLRKEPSPRHFCWQFLTHTWSCHPPIASFCSQQTAEEICKQMEPS